MKVGIAGYPGVGRTTLFSALAGLDLGLPAPGGRSKAVVEVEDPRLDHLRDVFQPRKLTRARFEVEDLPALPRSDARRRGEIVAELREPDALLLVVGAFEQARLVLGESLADPKAQYQALQDELLLLDLEAVERRLERIQERLSKGSGDRARLRQEEGWMRRVGEALEAGTPLPKSQDREEGRVVGDLRLFAQKAVVVVFNVEEGEELAAERQKALRELHPHAWLLCAPVEREIARIEDDERQQFLEEYGLAMPASRLLIRSCYESLDLISFFTVGKDEVRAWPLQRGSDAVTAAGRIHTDLARGFIRAEVTPYRTVQTSRDEREYRALARSTLMGRDYVVQDGDILNIRFSV